MTVGVAADARPFEQFLAHQKDIQIVGSCNELGRVASVAWKSLPHVMLVYLRGTQLALTVLRDIIAGSPEARVLVVVPICGPAQALEMIEGGAWGAITLAELPKQGLRAIRKIGAGEIWGSRQVLSRIALASVRHTSRQITQSKAMHALTGREGEIVKLLQVGSTNKEIAAQLFISDKTVKTHVHNILEKLNVKRRNKIIPSV
jgi:DNA-binding NarL/FixJ family response regulator